MSPSQIGHRARGVLARVWLQPSPEACKQVGGRSLRRSRLNNASTLLLEPMVRI